MHVCSHSLSCCALLRGTDVFRCIQKFYGENPPAKIGPNGDRNWSCPGCRGLCTCAACKRQQSKRESKKKSLASAQAAAAKEGKQTTGGSSTAGGDNKDGQPPVFSSSHDGVTPKAKLEPLDKADSDAVKAEQSDSGSSSSGSSVAETPVSGSSTLAPPLMNGAALEATSTEVSPATTHSTMSTSSSFGTTSSHSNGNTPPTPLTHLQTLSAVVTPAPVYSTLGGASFSPNMQLSSLSSLSSSPLMPLNQSMLYSSAFLSPNTTYTSLSNLPLFPSAFSSSPPSSPFTSTHLLLPGMSTPHIPVTSIGGMSSSVPSGVGLDNASNLLALTGPSPITWQRTLRAPAAMAAAMTPSPEQQQQQLQLQQQQQQQQQQQRTATPAVTS